MVALIFSGLPFSVKKIGNRGPAQHNRFPQNVLQHAAQCVRLFSAQIGSQPRWMNLRFPQALIRIDLEVILVQCADLIILILEIDTAVIVFAEARRVSVS